MRKNFKTLIGLLVIVLLASFCSSKKGGSNAGLALLALGGSSSDSKKDEVKKDTIDVSKAFEGIKDQVVFKADKDGVSAAAVTKDTWTAISGNITVPKDVTLTFAINVTTSLTGGTSGIITIGTFKAAGGATYNNSDKKFGLDTITKTSGYKNSGIVGLALAAKAAKAASSDANKAKLLAALEKNKASIVVAADKATAAVAVANAVTSSGVTGADATKVTTDANAENIGTTTTSAAGIKKQTPTPVGAATVSAFSNQSVSITLPTGVTFATLSAANVSATIITPVKDFGTSVSGGDATISVFVRKVSDTVAHVGLSATQLIALKQGAKFSFSFHAAAAVSKDLSKLALDKKVIEIPTGQFIKYDAFATAKKADYVRLEKKNGTLPLPPLPLEGAGNFIVFGEAANNVTLSAGSNLTISVSFIVPSTVANPSYARLFISNAGANDGSTYKEITKVGGSLLSRDAASNRLSTVAAGAVANLAGAKAASGISLEVGSYTAGAGNKIAAVICTGRTPASGDYTIVPSSGIGLPTITIPSDKQAECSVGLSPDITTVKNN